MYERPPPKGSAELFNPKGGQRRPTLSQTQTQSSQPQALIRQLPGPPSAQEQARESERVREAVANAILSERVAAVRLQDGPVDGQEGATRAQCIPAQAQAQNGTQT